MKSRSDLTTEKQNPHSESIDLKSTEEILQIINSEDKTVAHAVKRQFLRSVKLFQFVCPQLKMVIESFT